MNSMSITATIHRPRVEGATRFHRRRAANPPRMKIPTKHSRHTAKANRGDGRLTASGGKMTAARS